MIKQEQIEEIEKEYKEWAVDLLKVRFDLKPEAFDEHHKNNYSFENCADCLWNKIKGSIEELLLLKENQLPENAVVLTNEEYKAHKKLAEAVYEGGAFDHYDNVINSTNILFKERKNLIEDTRKETAEKIFEILYQWLALENTEKLGFVTIQKFDFLRKFREIYKQFDVEIKE